MGEQEPSRWLDLDPERAGLPVRLDEPIGDSLMLRRVGVPREIGLLVDLEHLPSGQRVRLEVAPAERMPERLAVHGDLAVSSLDDIGHEVAEAIRAAVPSLLGGATRLHEPTRTERLKLSPPVVDWERELSQSPGSLKIADHCDEACAFCSSPRASFAEGGSMPAPELVRARLAEWAGLGIREVQFVDREPTLNPCLAEYVAFARDAGFGAIRVNTNGVALADGVRLAALVEAGLSELCVSLHAPGAELSDRITGRAGGF